MHRSIKWTDSHRSQFTTGWKQNRHGKMKTFNDFKSCLSVDVSLFLISRFSASVVDLPRLFCLRMNKQLWSSKTPPGTWRSWFERTLFQALLRFLLQGSQISPDESKIWKRHQLPTALARFALGAWSNNREVLELLISFYTQTVNNCSQIKCEL